MKATAYSASHQAADVNTLGPDWFTFLGHFLIESSKKLARFVTFVIFIYGYLEVGCTGSRLPHGPFEHPLRQRDLQNQKNSTVDLNPPWFDMGNA